MLNGRLQHPDILAELARSGHGSKVLICDGNYPFKTKRGPGSSLVCLNLAPGLVSVTDVLAVLVETIPIEAAAVMVPEEGPEPEIFARFRELMPGIALDAFGRFPFYEEAADPHVSLAIATGDQRLFANLLVTIGVVPPA
ncbi:RbsD/FucU domain-containing protein [Salinarimonas sp. NSM]|uniref:RbsD/FucU domain-containing protein n=1 Tax=Salinarimonas sp. NSM TaxID=3458003 RepID=UPI00403606AD